MNFPHVNLSHVFVVLSHVARKMVGVPERGADAMPGEWPVAFNVRCHAGRLRFDFPHGGGHHLPLNDVIEYLENHPGADMFERFHRVPVDEIKSALRLADVPAAVAKADLH